MVSVLGKVGIGIAIVVGLYSVLLGALLTPYLQRFSLYAHKINTLFWHDINDPQQWGFAKNQVTPFNIQTPDGETLYAWHVLPIDVYTRNEQSLSKQTRPHGPVDNFEKTLAFGLLTSSTPSPARVVVNCKLEVHGNAGHVGQGWRTDTYRYLTAQPNTHVVTIDYRGFGKSTGSPTEAGLIMDGIALVKWVLHAAKIPPENIVILGQSLGTAVASAVALRFADPSSESTSMKSNEAQALLNDNEIIQPTSFAGVVLVAPFSSLPSLMLTYRIGGFVPILLPVRPFPFLANYLTSHMVDKWSTADRLARYYTTLGGNARLLLGSGDRSMGMLQVLHATNDLDITYRQTEIICRHILEDDGRCDDLQRGGTVLDVRENGKVRVRFEISETGGHNRIVTYSPVAAAIVRAFEDIGRK